MGSVPAEQEGRLPQGQKVNYPISKNKVRNQKRTDRERMSGDAMYNRGTLTSSFARRQFRGIAGPTVQDCKFKIAYWNCRSACREEFLDTLTETMFRRKISLIALDEKQLRRSDTRECCESFTLAHSGVYQNAKRTELSLL